MVYEFLRDMSYNGIEKRQILSKNIKNNFKNINYVNKRPPTQPKAVILTKSQK